MINWQITLQCGPFHIPHTLFYTWSLKKVPPHIGHYREHVPTHPWIESPKEDIWLVSGLVFSIYFTFEPNTEQRNWDIPHRSTSPLLKAVPLFHVSANHPATEQTTKQNNIKLIIFTWKWNICFFHRFTNYQ